MVVDVDVGIDRLANRKQPRDLKNTVESDRAGLDLAIARLEIDFGRASDFCDQATVDVELSVVVNRSGAGRVARISCGVDSSGQKRVAKEPVRFAIVAGNNKTE